MNKLLFAIILLITAPAMAEELPPYYAEYRYQAGLASDYVTSATDAVRAFAAPETYQAMLTSEGLRLEYRAKLNTLNHAISVVRYDLLSTATAVWNAGTQEVDALDAMSRYRTSP